MSKTRLDTIHALTFYAGEETKARRTDPIPQLTCVGTACKHYQPDVIRCTNDGGRGTDVDWKCEADLPSTLRFGRTDVSCEGWSGPGDVNVLKGSCGLEYRLVEIPGSFRSPYEPRREGFASVVFWALWLAGLGFIVFRFLQACCSDDDTTRRRPRNPPGPGYRPGPSGTFPGGYGGPEDSFTAPPPYSKEAPQGQQGGGWRPGFWTGAAVGGAGAHLYNRANRSPQTQDQDPPPQRARRWDWENRPRFGGSFFNGGSNPQPSRRSNNNNRGEGSSTMRQSTGLGGSSVR